MNRFAITLALAGSAAAAPLSAQARPVILNPTQQSGTNCAYTRTNNSVGDVIFGRANTSTCQDVYSREDGSWYQIGRGNTYERRVRDRNGNMVIQHARLNRNGTFTILNTRSGANDKQWRKAQRQANNRQDCTYSQSTNSVGDIIFGRSGNNTTNCVDNTGNRVNGGWYQVGRDNNGATIYERQTRDQNGNLIIQRARRNSNGTLSVISTRNAGNVNGSNNNGTYNNGTYNNGRNNNGTYNRRSDRDDDQGDNDSDHGKGKKYKDKDKDHGKGKGHDRD